MSSGGQCPVAQGGGSGWSDGVAQGDAEIGGWWGSSSEGWIWIVRRAWTGGGYNYGMQSMYVCMYIYICMYVSMYLCVYVCMYIYIYINI